MENKILSNLNDKQREGVTWGDGPLLIIAGAGTGKTKVITHRIAWLIASKLAYPEEILALTFTDKAAEEMETRVDVLVPYGMAPVWISTFHSFGQKILREYAFELGITPDFKILSESELLVFLKDRLFELPMKYFRPLSHPIKYLRAFLEIISRAKDENVNAQEYLKYAENKIADYQEGDDEWEEAVKQLEIANCYQKYEEFLKDSGYIDMPGLISFTLKLLQEKKGVLNKLQSQFKYILVDEFQDTNYAQFQILKLLLGSHRNITVVGDDDQSIYKFRGACLANILSFNELYPDAHTIVLTDNYRSTQQILDTARRLIVFNNPDRLEIKAGVNKSLKSVIREENSVSPSRSRHIGIPDEYRGDFVSSTIKQLKLFDKKVEYKHYDIVENEADSIAKLIEEKVLLGYKYSDFAILVRTNSLADQFIRSLNIRAIPWRFSGNQGLYDRPEVQILLSLLRVLRDINNTQALYRVIISPAYKINALDINKCMGLVYRTKIPLYEILKSEISNKLSNNISDEGRAGISNFLKDIEHFIGLSVGNSAGKVLYEFLTRSNWLTRIVSNPSIENEIMVKNIAGFLNIVERVSKIIRNDRAPFVIEHIEGLLELGDNPPVAEAEFDVDAVNVLTVHKAKGLEFRVVFMVGLVDSIFPHYKMASLVELPTELVKEPLPNLSVSEIHIQEERRLFYVGMTRAKEEVILTSARNYGGKKEYKPSQFIMEAMDLVKDEIVSQKTNYLERIKSFDSNVVDIKRVTRAQMLVLTSTAIDDWLTCPRKYWYIHWLKIPIPKHHTMVYGIAVHQAIESYLNAKKAGRKLTYEGLLKVFESAWVSEGFHSRKHEEERFAQGKKTLRQFLEQEEKDTNIPMFVEERFNFVIEDIKIFGRWDRIDIENPKRCDLKSKEVRPQIQNWMLLHKV